MSLKNEKKTELKRVPSGITGLDVLLQGGFKQGGTYLILGEPGSGKTILANQICFHEIARGGRAVYVTLLAESHSGMFRNLDSMAFFDEGLITDKIQYMNGYGVLERDGLDGLMKLLGGLILKHGATVLFIDGIASADTLASSSEQFKRFVHNLNSVVGMSGCTSFLLSSTEGDSSRPEHTMVDGILHLSQFRAEARTVREIEVRKFRGSGHFYGRHFFRITADGLEVFPRSEEVLGTRPPKVERLDKKLRFGVRGLDELIGGGLVNGSVSSLLGPVGTGKTTVGSCFLSEGAAVGDPGLLVSLYEHPERLVAKLTNAGLKFKSHVDSGLIQLQWRPPDEAVVDQMIARVLDCVHKKKIRRVFIDGIGGLKTWMLRPERLTEALTAFGHELRSLGITSIFTEETDLAGQRVSGSLSNFSAFSDNILEFRHVDVSGKRVTCLSIAKVRESDHDHHLHELVFGTSGIELGRMMKFMTPIFPPAEVISSPVLPITQPKGSSSKRGARAKSASHRSPRRKK